MIFESNHLRIEEAQSIKEELLALLKSNEPEVVLDLEYVTKADLSALQILLSFQKSLQALGRTLVLKNCTKSFKEALGLIGAQRVLECCNE